MPGLLESELPIVGAPMAGGPGSVGLVRAVLGAGGFGFVAGGYKTAEALETEVRTVRGFGRAFGVNLFVPGTNALDPAAFKNYAAELEPEAAGLGVELDARPVLDDDAWADKVAWLVAEPVPVVSVTFGLPPAGDIAALQRAGSRVLATVTTDLEARAAADAGVDGLVVQAPAAGGHSGTFDPLRNPAAVGATDLVRQVRAAVDLPIVAGGGVADAEDARGLMLAGAETVAVGTLLLRTDESGASQTHKDALADPTFTETVITHAFTGRPARALRNAFIDRHEATAPYGYPAIHHLTRGLRQAAAKAGDANRLHLWAGTGFRAAQEGPAAEVIRELARGL